MLDHQPIPIETFKGLWAPVANPEINKDNDQTCPPDHALVVNNFDFGISSLTIRERFALFGTGLTIIPRRLHRLDNGTGYLIGATNGRLYFWNTVAAPTLLYSGSTSDVSFSFLPWADRVYIIPSIGVDFYGHDSMLIYTSAGTLRFAGGAAPTSPGANVAIVGGGVVDAGDHFFGVAFETDTGFITPTAPTSPALLTMPPGQQVSFTNIRLGGAEVVARWLIMTRVITVREPADSLASYVSYFAHRIPDNTTTTFTLNLLDSQLLDDASYLNDIYANPPGGSGICTYRSRVVITAPTPSDRHKVIISRVNDPETFDKVTGVRIIDPSNNDFFPGPSTVTGVGTGLTGCQAFRDTLYLTKTTSTYALNDNGQEPDEWDFSTIDQTLGAAPYGIVGVRSSNKESIDYLIMISPAGVYLFSGFYQRPELTWKNKILSNVLADNIGNIRTRVNGINNFKSKKVFVSVFREIGDSYPKVVHMLDYTSVPEELNKYSKETKWSIWTFDTNFNPGGMTVGLNGIVMASNVLATNVWELGGASATKENPVECAIQFKSLRDADDKIMNIGGVRLIVSGNTAVQTNISVIARDINGLVPDHTAPSVIIDSTLPNDSIEPFIRLNFSAQRPSIKIVTMTDEELIINKLVQFAKPVFNALPFQYYK